VNVYQWSVFVHLAGVFGLLATHGVSMVVMFRLRTERDPARVDGLLQLSASSITPFWISTGVLLLGGIVAAFLGPDLWSYGWIWASIGTLVLIIVAMYVLARPYYRRVRFISRAMVEGSQAVSPEQFDRILRSGRPWAVTAIGVGGLLFILYLMLFKPTLGLAPAAPSAAAATGPAVHLGAKELSFTTQRLSAPAGEPFRIVFENAVAVPHNVSIRRGDEAEFEGQIVTGPTVVTYPVPALAPGEYTFVCDVHPEQMTGTLVAG
jgi:plastocyanin